MKEQYVEKINKMGKTGRIIAKICTVMLYIATVCCIVASILLSLLPKDGVVITTSSTVVVEKHTYHSIIPQIVGFETDDNGVFELNGIKYDNFEIIDTPALRSVKAESTPHRYMLEDMKWIFLSGIGFFISLIYAMGKISYLFTILEDCETPFTQEIADYFKKITMAFIPVLIFTWIGEAVSKWVMTGVVDIVIGVDMTMVMAVVVMLMLSEIFRYGTMLQAESDETL